MKRQPNANQNFKNMLNINLTQKPPTKFNKHEREREQCYVKQDKKNNRQATLHFPKKMKK